MMLAFAPKDWLLFSLALSAVAAALLMPVWWQPAHGRPARRHETLALTGAAFILPGLAAVVAVLLNLGAGFSLVLSALAGAVVACLLAVLLNSYRQGRADEGGLREAVQIAGKVYGVVSSGPGLLVALTRCSELYREGKMNLPLTGQALTGAVQTISLGKPAADVLRDLAQQFRDVDVLAEMFANYAAMSEMRLDADARAEYAQSVADTLTALDELRGVMQEDMTITRVTRAAILLFIVPGLTLYIAFFAGGIGETLRTTAAGLVTVLVNASVYVLLPLITRRLEKMPRANL
jgi:hypothetical protein